MNTHDLENNSLHAVPLKQTMRAVEYDDYGDANVLHLADHPIPQLLPSQLFIEVLASSVNPIDYRFRRGDMKGLIPFGFPRIPGYDVAGIVVDTDTDSSFSKGDCLLEPTTFMITKRRTLRRLMNDGTLFSMFQGKRIISEHERS